MITDQMVEAAVLAFLGTYVAPPTWKLDMRRALEAAEAASWQPMDSAPMKRDSDGIPTLIQLVATYPDSRGWTDIVGTAWWDDHDKRWARWHHSFSPTYWRPYPALPAAPKETTP